ncbi:MAG: hypothetical protein GTO03_07670, partial [Planctomycetales bacterium]|nr:hypothetical protein [Planctomycetales bacterium]
MTEIISRSQTSIPQRGERPAQPQTATRPAIAALLVACFALTIFLGAFLLFQVQPLISKAILPWYGGTPNVWTTCMLFFQSVLFAGYAYAHVSTRWLRPRTQGVLHIAL